MKGGLVLLVVAGAGVAIACWFLGRPAERAAVPVAAAPAGARVPVRSEQALEQPSPVPGPDEAEEAQEAQEEDAARAAPPRAERRRAGAGEREVRVVDLGPYLRRLEEVTHEVKGLVVDGDGAPTAVHVRLIGAEGGSSSLDSGRAEGDDLGIFSFPAERVFSEPFHLKATTLDGRVALESDLTKDDGRLRELVLELRPGAIFHLELGGELAQARCAIFQGGVRHEDFTLRRGKVEVVVLPVGSHLLELYEDVESDRVVHVRRTLAAAAGARERLRLEPGS